MNRRGFLKSILAAGVAPYVSTMAGVLMPVRAPLSAPSLILPTFTRETLAYAQDFDGLFSIGGRPVILTRARNFKFYNRALSAEELERLTK